MIKAFLLSPLVAPLLCFFGAVLFGAPGWDEQLFLKDLLFIAAPVSYLATAVFGLPFFELLKRLDLLSGPALAIGGVFFGVLSVILLSCDVSGSGFALSTAGSELFPLLGIGAVLGGSVALCFAYTSGITRRSTRTRADDARAG